MTDFVDQFADYEDDIGLSDDDKKFASKERTEWFKGVTGVSYRVALMYFHPLAIAAMKALKKRKPESTREDLEKMAGLVLAKRAEELGKTVEALQEYEKLDTGHAKFHTVPAHYKEGIGFVVSRLGMDGKEADELWKLLGEQKNYLCTTLLIYPTNKEGEVNKKTLLDGWEVKPWRFSGKVYSQLHQVAAGLKSNDLSIATQDLTLKCTNADFQNFEIQPSGKSVWRRLAEGAKEDNQGLKFQADVLSAACKEYATMKKPFRELSTADLAVKLGVSVGGSVGGAGGDVDAEEFNELLDQV